MRNFLLDLIYTIYHIKLVICKTLFMKHESQLVTDAPGPVKSMFDYIIGDRSSKGS